MSGEYSRGIRTSQQAVTVFAWWSKEHAVLLYSDGTLCVFSWLIPVAFCAAFSWSYWEQYLLELIVGFS